MIKKLIENFIMLTLVNIACFFLCFAIYIYYVDLKLNELDLKVRIQELHRELKCSNKWRV